MRTFQARKIGGVVVDYLSDDGRTIPNDPQNAEYIAALALVESGDIQIIDYVAPVVYNGLNTINARVRTTNATVTELYRATLALKTGYVARLELIAIDAVNGSVKLIQATVVAKRLAGGALIVGSPVIVATIVDTGGAATTSGVAGWTVTASAAGNDFVISVQGAAGRTVDWDLSGPVRSFAPDGA